MRLKSGNLILLLIVFSSNYFFLTSVRADSCYSNTIGWTKACGGIEQRHCCIKTGTEAACLICPWSKDILENKCTPDLTVTHAIGNTVSAEGWCVTPTESPPEGTAWLFADCNYKGSFTSIDTNSSTSGSPWGHFKSLGIGDMLSKRISSVKVGPHTYATLYRNRNFTGPSINISKDVDCLATSDRKYNDFATSAAVSACPTPAQKRKRGFGQRDTCFAIPKPEFSIQPLPKIIDIGQNRLSNLDGYQVKVVNADLANFFVPDGRTVPVSCKRLDSYKSTICKNNQSKRCRSITAAAKKCTGSIPSCTSSGVCTGNSPTCGNLSIKDNKSNDLKFALYTLEEWDAIYPGGLKVNANWFDIDGPPGFPHFSPCTDIYGYSVSNKTLASRSSKGDPVLNSVNLLDTLVIRETKSTNNLSTQSIEILENSKIAATTNVKQSVGGFIILENSKVRNSKKISSSDKPKATGARTGIGLRQEKDGSQTLYIVVVQNGPRRPGMTAIQLGHYLKRLGATDGINLDNSGSSQLIYHDQSTGKVYKTKKGDNDTSSKLAYRPIPNFLQILP